MIPGLQLPGTQMVLGRTLKASPATTVIPYSFGYTENDFSKMQTENGIFRYETVQKSNLLFHNLPNCKRFLAVSEGLNFQILLRRVPDPIDEACTSGSQTPNTKVAPLSPNIGSFAATCARQIRYDTRRR